MTKTHLASLQFFDDQWRTIADLKRRGVDEADLPVLLKRGLVEGRQCGAWGYQITELGQKALKTDLPTDRSS